MLGRAVAVGHVLGPAAGLRETDRLRAVIGDRHRWHAVRGHLLELAQDPGSAADAYAEARRQAADESELDVSVFPSDNAWSLDEALGEPDH